VHGWSLCTQLQTKGPAIRAALEGCLLRGLLTANLVLRQPDKTFLVELYNPQPIGNG